MGEGDRAEPLERLLNLVGLLLETPVPLTFDHGAGALLWDVDGNEYVDYAAGMGPMILGHCHPAVASAVQASLSTGQLFAGQNRYESELAEMLVGALPWIESIRIGLTGTEIHVGAGSHVKGGIHVEKPNTQWLSIGKRKPPRIIVGPNARVDGVLVFEREVKLYVHRSAKIGPVTGATAVPYESDRAPQD